MLREGIADLISMLADIDEIKDISMTTNGQLLESMAPALAAAGLHRLNISLDTVDPIEFRKISEKGSLAPVLAGIDSAIEAGLEPIKLNCVVEKSSSEPRAVAVRDYARSKGLEVRFIRTMNLLTGDFWPVEGGNGGICSKCNRIRLTSDGLVLPCLFSDQAYSVKELGIEPALKRAIQEKPARGKMSTANQFMAVGG